MQSGNDFCPLCGGKAVYFGSSQARDYHRCEHCLGIFLDRAQLPLPADEKSRYLEHNNDVNDPRYQDFVRPIVSAVRADFSASHRGLDFGAGTGPVITKLLTDAGYHIRPYDPYFHDFPELLQERYDYITCCEVIEHFYHPAREFGLLRSLLNPGGALYCMTVLYNETIDFETWYYKNDPTHVFFYHPQSLAWIGRQFGFARVEAQARLITFRVL